MKVSNHFEKELDEISESPLRDINEDHCDDFMYDVGSYVAVLFEDKTCPFWMGQVHSILPNCEGRTTIITLHWFQSKDVIYHRSCSLVFLAGAQRKGFHG